MFPFDVNKYSVCAGSCLGHYPKVRLLKHSSFSHWIKALDFLLQSGQGKGGECFMNITKVTSWKLSLTYQKTLLMVWYSIFSTELTWASEHELYISFFSILLAQLFKLASQLLKILKLWIYESFKIISFKNKKRFAMTVLV